MTERPHCRIGKVRFKSSPNISVLIPNKPGLPEAALHKIHGYLDDIWKSLEPEGVAGLLVVGWNMKSRYVRAGFIHDDSPVTQTLAPSFVAEVIRGDVTIDLVHEVMNGRKI